ncbi:hypothetical protein [Nocardioides sp. CFH 31398]|uniref:hypothetical protein n=1 Tax=Nocardioides sp. CFH 31398 TaxID=2919579 RepID=UPI001F05C04F|nr:hypothetical protein [Nocardioides sp. CFH 31398]MCH1866296.1 hypothetical protein [Nocardioides sp. CFH 31398]
MSVDWCDLCELPKSQCPHGAPPPPPRPAKEATPVRTRSVRSTSAGARGSATSAAPAAPRPPAKPRTPPGRTPQTEFRKHLLAVLATYPVAAERDAVLDEMGERMTLTTQDRGITADGQVRWRRAAMKERAAMAEEGLVASEGHALWVLTATGRSLAAELAEEESGSEESGDSQG